MERVTEPGEYTGNPLRRGIARKMIIKEMNLPMGKTISFVKGKGSISHNNGKRWRIASSGLVF